MNMEARGEVASMLNRKCVVLRWAELSYESFLEMVERGAGSILILLPLDIDSVDEELIEVITILKHIRVHLVLRFCTVCWSYFDEFYGSIILFLIKLCPAS